MEKVDDAILRVSRTSHCTRVSMRPRKFTCNSTSMHYAILRYINALNNNNNNNMQGRIILCIILCAGCTMGGPPAARAPRRSAAKFLPRCFDV